MFNTKDGKYKTTNIRPLGTPPPILDSTLVEISRNQIEKYLKSKGYFNAKVQSEIKVKKQRAEVFFKADTGMAFTINKVTLEIPDEKIKQLYLEDKAAFTHLKEGKRYDDDSLGYERDQIYQVMKQRGYFDFSRPYVKFSVDSNLNSNKANVTLIIDNPVDKPKHLQYHLGEVNILIASNADGFPTRDSIKMNERIYKDIRFTDLSGKFRRNPITRYNFLTPGEQYDIRNENVTYDRMYELNVFKNVKIDYNRAKDSSNTVNPVIQLIPQKIMSNRIEGEVPFNAGTVGFTLSNTFTNNNLFRGAEKFEFQIKGGLQARLGQGKSFINEIYQRDFSVSTTLTVPRLMIPFTRSKPGRGGMPHTIFSASYVYALQKDFFQRKVVLTSVAYEFRETKSKFHTVTPLNFEYRFGGLLFDEGDTTNVNFPLIANNLVNLILLNRKNVTFGIKYSYSLNAEKLLSNGSFIYFKGDLDLAGNALQGISKLLKTKVDSTGAATIFGVPFNQYVRPEVDIRWYKGLGGDKQFVARINAGIAYAYGNSRDGVPFEKLFYGGGSSGIRSWQARTLGPGNYNRGESLKSETERRILYGFDQTGELHIETNFEYRYKLLNKFFGAKLKGAVFLDAGNIWNVSGGASDTRFDFKKLGNQIALGAGTGFRYDVQYFVFRFDVGLKLKDPQFSGSDQWVISKFLGGGKAFRNAYDAMNTPDRYRFVQYNFGIGMPF
jgi:outer membrane protein insertion porin family